MNLQILNLARNKADIAKRVHSIIDKFAERGLRSLAVARQVVISFNSAELRFAEASSCNDKLYTSCRKYPREPKKVLVVHGNLLVFSLSLIHHVMTVLRLSEKL